MTGSARRVQSGHGSVDRAGAPAARVRSARVGTSRVGAARFRVRRARVAPRRSGRDVAVPSGTVRILALSVALPLASCAAGSGPYASGEPTIVRFSYEKLEPATVRIATGGNVAWVSLAADSSGYILFPATSASGFPCGEKLGPDFQRTPAGFQSRAITGLESERVELPCAPRPGSYPYEIWLMGTGLGETVASRPELKLRGTIVVE